SANKQEARREVWHTYEHDGSLVFHGRLPAEKGALLLKALEMAVQRADSEVSAEKRPPSSYTAYMADALVELAESYLEHGCETSSTADRYQVVVHVAAETLKSDAAEDVSAETSACASADENLSAETQSGTPADEDLSAETSALFQTHFSYLEDGPRVSAETSRRISCDASLVRILDDEKGEPLSIGRNSRIIPPTIRRALKARDDGCRFPGSTHQHLTDGRHIKHWADGDETSMENIVRRCRSHHRLVPERGLTCQRTDDGKMVFSHPRGSDIDR